MKILIKTCKRKKSFHYPLCHTHFTSHLLLKTKKGSNGIYTQRFLNEGRDMGVFCEYNLWFIFCFSFYSAVCNIELYWTVAKLHTTTLCAHCFQIKIVIKVNRCTWYFLFYFHEFQNCSKLTPTYQTIVLALHLQMSKSSENWDMFRVITKPFSFTLPWMSRVAQFWYCFDHKPQNVSLMTFLFPAQLEIVISMF